MRWSACPPSPSFSAGIICCLRRKGIIHDTSVQTCIFDTSDDRHRVSGTNDSALSSDLERVHAELAQVYGAVEQLVREAEAHKLEMAELKALVRQVSGTT